MSKIKKEIDSKKLAALVVLGMQEKKAEDIVVLDMRKIGNAEADFFVIGSANSENQLDAISDSIEDTVFKLSNQRAHVESGEEGKSWILLDYFDVVAHVFTKDKRSFYDLEELWSDSKITHLSEGQAFK
jgi:ribosome-associated protein